MVYISPLWILSYNAAELECVRPTGTSLKMATGTCNEGSQHEKGEEGIKWNVTCGVTEIPGKKTVTLMYTIPDHIDQITWDWQYQTNEDGSKQHIAQMLAHSSKRGNRSRPVPDPVFQKLGSIKKSRENKYFKVQITRKDNVSIEEYFNT